MIRNCDDKPHQDQDEDIFRTTCHIVLDLCLSRGHTFDEIENICIFIRGCIRDERLGR